jgi:hypothetical protein
VYKADYINNTYEAFELGSTSYNTEHDWQLNGVLFLTEVEDGKTPSLLPLIKSIDFSKNYILGLVTKFQDQKIIFCPPIVGNLWAMLYSLDNNDHIADAFSEIEFTKDLQNAAVYLTHSGKWSVENTNNLVPFPFGRIRRVVLHDEDIDVPFFTMLWYPQAFTAIQEIHARIDKE